MERCLFTVVAQRIKRDRTVKKKSMMLKRGCCVASCLREGSHGETEHVRVCAAHDIITFHILHNANMLLPRMKISSLGHRAGVATAWIRASSSRCASPYPTDVFLPDLPSSWAAAGFEVIDNRYAAFEGLRIWLGSHGHPETAAWSFVNFTPNSTQTVCSLPVIAAPVVESTIDIKHPNGSTGIDHIVLKTQDAAWVEQELRIIGIIKRKQMENARLGISYSFYRPGNMTIEVISNFNSDKGPPTTKPKAELWGITFVTPDIDFTHNFLKDATKPPRAALQKGRRITTLDTLSFGISTRVAFMSPHV